MLREVGNAAANEVLLFFKLNYIPLYIYTFFMNVILNDLHKIPPTFIESFNPCSCDLQFPRPRPLTEAPACYSYLLWYFDDLSARFAAAILFNRNTFVQTSKIRFCYFAWPNPEYSCGLLQYTQFFNKQLLYKQQCFNPKSSKLSNLKASKFEFKQYCGLLVRYHLIQTFSIVVQFVE